MKVSRVRLTLQTESATADEECRPFLFDRRCIRQLVDEQMLKSRVVEMPSPDSREILRIGNEKPAGDGIQRRLHWDVDPINLRPDELKALAASGLATCDRLSQT